jgi:hypothetical protein
MVSWEMLDEEGDCEEETKNGVKDCKNLHNN